MKTKKMIFKISLICSLFLSSFSEAAQYDQLSDFLGTWEFNIWQSGPSIKRIYVFEAINISNTIVYGHEKSGNIVTASENFTSYGKPFYSVIEEDYYSTIRANFYDLFFTILECCESNKASFSDNLTSDMGFTLPNTDIFIETNSFDAHKIYTPSTTTTTTMTTTTTVSNICPSEKILDNNNQKLEKLRHFRDTALKKTALGRKIIQIYYDNAASINLALDRNPTLLFFTKQTLEIIF